eukprot:2910388-Prymnesium_polylepis.1
MMKTLQSGLSAAQLKQRSEASVAAVTARRRAQLHRLEQQVLNLRLLLQKTNENSDEVTNTNV